MAMATTEHVARLAAVPPGAFTATRNRIVAELRKAGRGAEARAVARLRRPSAALWAVNRLAAVDGKGVSTFIDAVDRLRRAQLRDARGAADARQAQRAALQSLVARAVDVLARSGLVASPSIVRKVSDTLMGAAVDRTSAAALRRGTVPAELAAPGFEAFSGARPLRLVVPAGAPRRVPDDESARRARPDDAERRRQLQVDALRRQAAEHTRSLTRLEGERVEVQARLAELRQKVREARRAARQATAAASRTRRRPAG
jgi:hypothetical protein